MRDARVAAVYQFTCFTNVCQFTCFTGKSQFAQMRDARVEAVYQFACFTNVYQFTCFTGTNSVCADAGCTSRGRACGEIARAMELGTQFTGFTGT